MRIRQRVRTKKGTPMNTVSDFEGRPRLSIDISSAQRRALLNLNLPHGMQKQIFSALLDDMIRFLHNCSPGQRMHFYGLVAARAIDTVEILSAFTETSADKGTQ